MQAPVTVCFVQKGPKNQGELGLCRIERPALITGDDEGLVRQQAAVQHHQGHAGWGALPCARQAVQQWQGNRTRICDHHFRPLLATSAS